MDIRPSGDTCARWFWRKIIGGVKYLVAPHDLNFIFITSSPYQRVASTHQPIWLPFVIFIMHWNQIKDTNVFGEV
jgi:hypothetical protein